MHSPENKVRIAITIHKETKELMNELLSLHENFTYSNLIEVALLFYSKALESKMQPKAKKNKEAN